MDATLYCRSPFLQNGLYRCVQCQCDVSQGNQSQHEAGARHRSKQPSAIEQVRTKKKPANKGSYRCVQCQCDVPQFRKSQHEAGARHKSMQHRIGNQHPLIQPTRIAHHYDANVAVQRTRSRQRVSQGSRPHMQQLPYKVELPHCPIPPELQLHLAQTQVEFFLLQRRPMRQAAQNYLTRMIQSGTVTLTLENFGVVLSSLLFVEEAEICNEMRRYDITGPALEQCEHHFLRKLMVPGLSEKRPSVLRNDKVLLVEDNVDEHLGFVHFVRNDHVLISFDHKKLQALWERNLENVVLQFTVKRCDYQLLHRAIDVCSKEGLFLSGEEYFTAAKPVEVGRLNPTVRSTPAYCKLNDVQKQAVDDAVSPAAQRLRLIWGPPGTGKTTTLAAYIGEIVCRSDGAPVRVLVVTPSNAASDHITSLLKSMVQKPIHLLRVVAPGRPCKHVPDNIRQFTTPAHPTDDHDYGHRMATDEELGAARVVVVTLGTASRLYGCHPEWRCTHLVVDEAGQATEELLCAGLQLCDKRTTQQFILAGDPKQLGPIIHSPVAKRFHADVSPLSRLCDTPACQRSVLSKLIVNYRSHPTILSLVNVFYNDELKPCDPQNGKYRRVLTSGDKRVRILHCDGAESKEADSPSLMNISEADKVLELVLELLRIGEQPSDIVVLTPYLKQAQKINAKIHYNHNHLHNVVRAVTIEAFQGNEAKNIILSCVRSQGTDCDVKSDIQRQLGFLQQPQRLNVAISRAIDRLWIVGNVKLLCRDPHWKRVFVRALEVDVAIENHSLTNRLEDMKRHIHSAASDLVGGAGDVLEGDQHAPITRLE